MWALVKHQLENARTLAALDRGRPRQASLRRAVSTAYYALFQALAEKCARALVGSEAPWEVFTPIFRALEHRQVAQALRQRPLTDTPELQRIGITFSDLLSAREWADYNPEPRPNFDELTNSAPFVRAEAARLIDAAEEAIQLLDRLDEPTRLRLATRLVTKSRK